MILLRKFKMIMSTKNLIQQFFISYMMEKD